MQTGPVLCFLGWLSVLISLMVAQEQMSTFCNFDIVKQINILLLPQQTAHWAETSTH